MTSVAIKKRKPHTATAKPETLTDQAYNRLEEMIVTLALAPGAVLSEQSLSADLSIGRTPIREALQRLAIEELVVLEVRRELERLLARCGAERASPEERARFQAVADGMDAAAQSNDDIAF